MSTQTKKKVMVIEPDENTLSVLGLILKEDGYDVYTTRYVNFPKILEIVPDLVLLAHSVLVGGETKEILAVFNRIKMLNRVVLMTTATPVLMKREFPEVPTVYKPFHIEELKDYL